MGEMMRSNHRLTAQLVCHSLLCTQRVSWSANSLSFCKKTKCNCSICTLLHPSLQKEEKEGVTGAMISCDSLKANQQLLILKHSPQLSIQKYMCHLKSLSTAVLQKQIYFIFTNIFI